jgi:gamma-glutamylaminecyclotransferase
MTTTLFVYGTLKRGGLNHHHLAAQTFHGPAHTAPGFTLFSLGVYPGLVAAPTDDHGVTGELWSVDPACLARLDVLEGLNEGLYRRAPIALIHPIARNQVAASPAISSAETYFYLRDLSGRPHLGATWPI